MTASPQEPGPPAPPPPGSTLKSMLMWMALPLFFVLVSGIMIWRDKAGTDTPAPPENPPAAAQPQP